MLERRRRKSVQNKVLYQTGSLVLIACLLVSFLWVFNGYNGAIPVYSGAGAESRYHNPLLFSWNEVLFSGIPLLASNVKKQPAVRIVPEYLPRAIVRDAVNFFTSVDLDDIRSLFYAQIPLIASMPVGQPSINAKSFPDFPKFDHFILQSGGKPIVGIYHTHTAEAFLPDSGVTHKPGGQVGDIVEVGAALARRLETHGISALQSRTVHDYPSFMKAYGPSEQTVKRMLAENPSIQMVFDIHRDADKRENTVAVINGSEVARISIIVATGQPDLIQPNWKKNHAFAKLIDAKLNSKYPGLSRGIQLVEWRYNQHLHPRSLLLEVGCQETSLAEATRSMEMLGDALAEIIAENQ